MKIMGAIRKSTRQKRIQNHKNCKLPETYRICKPNVKFNAGSKLIAKEFVRIAQECGFADEDQLIKEWENENNN